MGWRGLTAVALLLVAAVPLAPATVPGCGGAHALLAAPTRAAQNDANLSRDAPDDAPGSALLRMPAPADGEQGDYYWAWLDPPLHRDGADASDWYAFELAAVEKVLMLELVSNYTMKGGVGAYTDFRATAFGPDGRVVHLHSAAGRVHLDDAAGGRWTVHVVPDGAVANVRTCSGLDADAEGGAPAGISNHGLYVGCRPVCRHMD